MTNLPATMQGQMPSLLRNLPDDSGDLSAGIGASFGVVTYRGKVWRVKYAGEEQIVMHPTEPGMAMPFLDVVIVKAAPVISKIFYQRGYTEGSNEAPDCFSVDGISPDPGATNPQAPKCATCPHNAWGSRVTDSGKRGKACGDNKRLAIVPESDIKNERYGGPLMLRVPAASLQDLASYNTALQRAGGRYYGAVTRIQFDVNDAYPHLLFTPKRWLSDEECQTVLEHQNSDVTARILNAPVEGARAEVEAPAAPMMTGAPPRAAAVATPPVGVSVQQPVQAMAPVQQTTVQTVMAPTPQPVAPTPSTLDDLAIPEGLRRTAPAASTFAPPPPPPPQPTTVTATVVAMAPVTQPGQPETEEQMRARLRAEILQEEANKKNRKRTVRAPGPTNADTTQPAEPAAPPAQQGTAAPEVPVAPSGPGTDALAALDAKLNALLPS